MEETVELHRGPGVYKGWHWERDGMGDGKGHTHSGRWAEDVAFCPGEEGKCNTGIAKKVS